MFFFTLSQQSQRLVSSQRCALSLASAVICRNWALRGDRYVECGQSSGEWEGGAGVSGQHALDPRTQHQKQDANNQNKPKTSQMKGGPVRWSPQIFCFLFGFFAFFCLIGLFLLVLFWFLFFFSFCKERSLVRRPIAQPSSAQFIPAQPSAAQFINNKH